MLSSNLKLDDLKDLFNYISESIAISDENYNIVLINDAAVKKLGLHYETIYSKTLFDYIPEDQVHKVKTAIEKNNNEYYEVELRRENHERFPALVSGTQMILDNKKYRVSTILDVTELKQKEEELLAKSKTEVKKLKTHIISNVNDKATKINEVKNASLGEINSLKTQITEMEYDNFKLEKQLISLKKENNRLSEEIERIKDESFEFETILELEIARAKAFKLNFTLVKVVIDDFEELKEIIGTKSKLKILLSAIKRQFKNSVKSIDIVHHDIDDVYYLVLANAANINITKVVENLIIPKKMEDNINITFSYGVAHFFDKDDSKGMLYRCDKSLESYMKEKEEKKS